VGLQRALFPDYMQRSFAAASQTSLKWANIILLLAPFVIQVPLCFYGLIGQVQYPNDPAADKNQIFTKVVKEIVGFNDIGAAIGSLMMAASVAAIMSTADSVLIAVSHIVTMDVVKPFIDPNDTPEELTVAGEEPEEKGAANGVEVLQVGDVAGAEDQEAATASDGESMKLRASSITVTLLLCGACVPLAGFEVDLSDMIQFQAIFLAQLFPLFLGGLYVKSVTAEAVIVGLLIGLGVGIPLKLDERKYSILLSVGCNCVFVTCATCFRLVYCCVAGRDDACDDSIRGSSLMSCIALYIPAFTKEPIQSPILWSCVLLPWLAIPFYRDWVGYPPTDELLMGTPVWAFTALMVLLLTHLLLVLVCVVHWTEAEPEAEGAEPMGLLPDLKGMHIEVLPEPLQDVPAAQPAKKSRDCCAPDFPQQLEKDVENFTTGL